MITIVNYGLGNLGSVQNILKRIGAKCEISSEPADIDRADKIILPGVGNFDAAMKKINELGFRKVLDKKAMTDKVPILGICLGMQLLTNGSEEGCENGLGWINARAQKFVFTDRPELKVPHMGWNHVKISNCCPLTAGFDDEYRFYFVHSFNVNVFDQANSMLKTTYGIEFDSGIFSGNIFGVQFHPEKSHRFGMNLLKNFASL